MRVTVKQQHLAAWDTQARSIWSLNASRWYLGFVSPSLVGIVGILKLLGSEALMISSKKSERPWSPFSRLIRFYTFLLILANALPSRKFLSGSVVWLPFVATSEWAGLWFSCSRKSHLYSRSTLPTLLPTRLNTLLPPRECHVCSNILTIKSRTKIPSRCEKIGRRETKTSFTASIETLGI